ncbi:MAG: methyltransferase domain-containing protein [Acidobacteria bacterium]|nr:methyltransferase domain-containing protein [Acidobacteriota bacterium]
MVEASTDAIERFRAAVAGGLGLQFEEAKLGFLAGVLQRRLQITGQPVERYLSRLESEQDQDEVGALAQELTVGETYFFRNADHYRALTEHVLPERLAAHGAARVLRILSLGCASGEEPYSLAIMARTVIQDPAWPVSILGVDVNPVILDKARRGRYSEWALRETPADVRHRWFRAEGGHLVLDDALREAVRFERHNLVDEHARVWQLDPFDVIFCRNVLMYFTPAQAHALVGRTARLLQTGGYLFLGHAETLRGLSTAFHLRHTHGTFYYQRKDAPGSAAQREQAPPARAHGLPLPADGGGFRLRPEELADTWIATIGRAAARVAALAEAPRPRPIARAGQQKPGWELGLVLELLRKERFADALAMVEALPPESGGDPDVLLLHAVLLTHGGQLARAEEVCQRLLDVDDLNAGAHYLLALCREGSSDVSRALHHDQAAAYLDPGFAMPRLHLGLLSRRAGDRAAARQELGQALVLLQREEASRILLFGGGFGREALVALCRAELVACGGMP